LYGKCIWVYLAECWTAELLTRVVPHVYHRKWFWVPTVESLWGAWLWIQILMG
jgi:hypothetical protein